MRCLIIEDEVPAQQLMLGLIKELRPQWEIAPCLDSIENSVSWLKLHPHPDIIFMDIQLSDGLSFEILEKVKIESMIIFTTAYNEYAIRAFKVNSIDYLLKPIKKSHLLTAIEKFEHYNKQKITFQNNLLDISELVGAINKPKPNYRHRFLINVGEFFFPLSTQAVAYIFSRNRITSIVTFEGKRYVIDFTLDRLEEELNPQIFFRVNRQFFVNIKAVSKVHTFFNGKLLLETQPAYDEKISISREKARPFKNWLDK